MDNDSNNFLKAHFKKSINKDTDKSQKSLYH